MRIFYSLLALTCLLLFITPVSFGQRFERGTIIQLNGDSLHGWINRKSGAVTAKYILYKKARKDRSERFNPDQIAGFRYEKDQKLYLSKKLTLDITDRNISYATGARKTSRDIETEHVFIELVYNHKLKLYRYSLDGPYSYYILEDDGGAFVPLTNYSVYDDITKTVVDHPEYKNELVKSIGSCPEVNIGGLTYTFESLTNAIDIYVKCKYGDAAGKPVAVLGNDDEYHIRWGIVVAPTFANYYNARKLIGSGEFSKFLVEPGIFLQLPLTRYRNNFSVIGELLYRSFDIHKEESKEVNAAVTETRKFHVALSYLGLNVLLRYQFTSKKVQPFVNLGIANNFKISESNNEFSVEKEDFPGNGKEIDEIYGVEQALLFGGGIHINKFEVEARYNFSNGIGWTSGDKTRFHSTQVLLKYSFR
ncbi:hypothetical protein COR50_01930 [Chitinophaga caeni]|uniref:Outer membrane protein beta-barrel domain-containing protein n=1 Tax=Chitinophaga caeni TaxID=2029983 RepID=A0A291QQ12_9BACT|nr:outer membrane beta-barrel protein [Chitinophaga caeni]ATL46017.1 hypothetical protein COR50_01930 [Chitinophaga caeni]